MEFEFYYTLLLFVLLTYVLVKELIPPELAIFLVLMMLIVGNVVTVEEAFSGFSNTGMLTIAMLFVITGSLHATGALDLFIKFLFGAKEKSIPKVLTRILFPLASLSAFLNNTPIVAMLIPGVKKWCERNDVPPSKLLIPLSYAAILGGMTTLIGTSTNLIVHGLLLQNGDKGFYFFEFSYIGIPIALAGLLYIIIWGHKILPEKKSAKYEFGTKTREYVIELLVSKDYNGIGKTIEAAGLRHLKGLYLFQVERDNKKIAPISPTEILIENDRLFFTGLPTTILELQKTKGLNIMQDSHFDLKNYDSDLIKTYEVVLSFTSPLVGKNVRAFNFRDKYNAVIIAIHRNGERIEKKIGDINLRAGDTLLLLADKAFKRRWYNSIEFSLISEAEDIPSKPKWQSYFSLTVFIISLMLAIFNILPLVTCMGIAATLLVLAKSISGSNLINSVDWKVLLIIASSFGIAMGMVNSGVGSFFAQQILYAFKPLGMVGIIAGIFLITSIYTNIITNNTAAVLLFPIALGIASELNINVHPFALTIAIAASASFATPISYQTNMMVYGPGNYKFKDFLKIGLPLQIISFVIGVILIYNLYF